MFNTLRNRLDLENELEHEMARRFPHVTYDGGIREYEDEQDYTSIALKGVRLG